MKRHPEGIRGVKMTRLIIGLILVILLLVPVSCAPAAVEEEELVRVAESVEQ